MTDRDDQDAIESHRETMSRRMFLEGVIAVSAASCVTAAPHAAAAAIAAPASPSVLTAAQSRTLTAVLNRLIPADAGMPAAGDLGLAAFVDRVVSEARHLRRHVVSVLDTLPEPEALDGLPGVELDESLRRIEQQEGESFDLLLQIAYAGYYAHPKVLQALNAESDQMGHLRLDRFDAKQLDTIRVQRDRAIRTD